MKRIAPGTLIGDKYELRRAVGSGGGGSIWAARHIALDMRVAIKFVHPGNDAAASAVVAARFEREAKVSAKIRSPHVVEVKDYGFEQGIPYLVMELLEGEDLAKRIRREGPLPLIAVDKVIQGVCKALTAAHEAKVIHRDLKPANIFLARVGPEEITKVFDFGVAKGIDMFEGEEMTQTGMLIGTTVYMSPEQVRDSKRVDGRSDLWSLAVVAFRALTLRLPFNGDGMEVLAPILRDEPPSPSSLVPALGPEVDAFFTRGLAKDPARRFQSAEELAKAFAGLCDTRPPRSSIAAGDTVCLPTLPVPDRARPSVSQLAPTPPVLVEQPTSTALGTTLPAVAAAHRPARRALWRWPAVAGSALLAVALWRLWLERGPAAAAPDAGAVETAPATSSAEQRMPSETATVRPVEPPGPEASGTALPAPTIASSRPIVRPPRSDGAPSQGAQKIPDGSPPPSAVVPADPTARTKPPATAESPAPSSTLPQEPSRTAAPEKQRKRYGFPE